MQLLILIALNLIYAFLQQYLVSEMPLRMFNFFVVVLVVYLQILITIIISKARRFKHMIVFSSKFKIDVFIINGN